jgi:NADH-quinone oxidoreductase subunit M
MTSAWPPISSVIIVPALAALLAMGPWFTKERDTHGRLCRIWALLTSGATLVLLLAIARAGLSNPEGFLRIEESYPWIPSWGVSFHLTLDGLSFVFALLTAVVTLAVIGWSTKPAGAGPAWYALLLLGQSAVTGAFLATDLVLFYVLYELMLVPVLMAMVLWGGARKLHAALKFLLYTMFGSVFMFVAILYLGWQGVETMQQHSGVTAFAFEIATLSSMPRLGVNEQILLCLCFLVAFGVKVPAVPLHGWLADTYREAPHGVAAFTAALLGKVGLYGVIRFVLPLFPDAMMVFGPYIAAIGAIGVVYGGLIALAQREIRSLLAYSSLSHLGFCILGIAAVSEMAVTGAVFQAVSHGLVTAALFLLFGAIIDREGAGDFESLGGLAAKLPVTAFFLMIFSLAAVALPLTSSFVGEFLILMGAWESYPQWTVVAMAGVVIGAVYTLTAYMRTMFGGAADTVPLKRADIGGGDLLVMGALAVVVLVLGVMPSRILSVVESSVSVQLQAQAQVDRAPTGSDGIARAGDESAAPQTISLSATEAVRKQGGATANAELGESLSNSGEEVLG